jgi:hypothetical protein
VAPGDSGGPVIDEEGRLLGINTDVQGRLGVSRGRDTVEAYHCIAVTPDPAWIQTEIDQDRAKQKRHRR